MLALVGPAFADDSATSTPLVQGESLPTGRSITPTAADRAIFLDLDPHHPTAPDVRAGGAAAVAVSPDGKQLAILTSAYNTFFDRSGKTIPPGQIRVDESSDFRTYFNSGQFGGAFTLRATFPVTGDSSQVGGVDVEMTNSAGVAKTQRISF